MSWGILFPLGVIIARYMKIFPSADPAWFYIHIGCQLSAYIIGVAGWGTGLKLGSESEGIQFSSHRNIGITLFCLATIQVNNQYFLIFILYEIDECTKPKFKSKVEHERILKMPLVVTFSLF